MIGIIGGSGFYSLLEDVEKVRMETPFGQPSSEIAVGKIADRDIAFLPRHGSGHEWPPHRVPYKANIWALHELGVERILAVAAVGSLKPHIKPGDVVVPNQFVNFTHGRDDTFYHGKQALPDNRVTHISSADPFCPELRRLLAAGAATGFCVHQAGTVVVIQGPRFSTRAESEYFRSHGWDIIGMTLYPECILARELQMCYAALALVTDYDTGVKDDPNVEAVSADEVIKVFNQNTTRLRSVLLELVPKIPKKRDCICSRALEGARI